MFVGTKNALKIQKYFENLFICIKSIHLNVYIKYM